MSRTRDFADLINGISAAKITSGTFADARLSSSSVTQHVDLSSIDSDYVQARQATADLSNLNASNLTSGTIPSGRLSLGTSDIPSLPTSKITSGTLAADRIPDLPTSKITSGTLAADRIPDLPTSKITSGTFDDARVPDLAASKITSGSFSDARIPNLATSKITSGTFADARIPNLAASKITSGTFADARLASTNVTQHVDLSNLNASNLTSGTVPNARISLDAAEIPNLPASKITSGSFADGRIPNLSTSKITSGSFADARIPSLAASKITSGTFANGRISSGSVTQHVSSTTSTSGTWTPAFSAGAIRAAWGYYYRIGNLVHCIGGAEHDGGPNSGSPSGAPENNNEWYVYGLPFTSNNNGKAAGGGICYPNARWKDFPHQAVIRSNSTQIKIFSIGADGGDARGYAGQTTHSAGSTFPGAHNAYFTNRNARVNWNEWSRYQGSNSRGWCWISVQYYI